MWAPSSSPPFQIVPQFFHLTSKRSSGFPFQQTTDQPFFTTMFKSIISLALVAGAAAFAPATPFVARSNTALFMSAELEAKVRDIIVEQLGVDADKVVPEASFIDDLGADSLDTVELIMAIEEEFDTEIPEEQAATIATVKDAIDFVSKL
jgi:acyl carrier protein